MTGHLLGAILYLVCYNFSPTRGRDRVYDRVRDRVKDRVRDRVTDRV